MSTQYDRACSAAWTLKPSSRQVVTARWHGAKAARKSPNRSKCKRQFRDASNPCGCQQGQFGQGTRICRPHIERTTRTGHRSVTSASCERFIDVIAVGDCEVSGCSPTGFHCTLGSISWPIRSPSLPHLGKIPTHRV